MTYQRLRSLGFINLNDWRVQLGCLVLITLLAALLRFYKLGEWSLWIDEIFTITRAQGHFNPETLLEQWWRPPISVILTGGVLQILGVSEWSARLSAALIGIVSIPLVYFPVKKLFNPGVAMITALLLAISPWHLFWSQNARFYTSLMVLYFLAAVAFYLYVEEDRIKYLATFFLLFFFALSERFNAAILVPVLVIYLLLLWFLPFEKPKKLRGKTITAMLVVIVGLGLLEIYSLLTTGITQTEFAFRTFFANPIDDPIRIFILTAYNIGLPVLALGFFGGFHLLRQLNRKGLFFFIYAFIPLILVLAISPFLFTVDRYLFITLPGWIILCAVFVREIIRQSVTHKILVLGGILMLLVLDAFGSHLVYYQINHGNRPDWRQAFAFVQARRSGDEPIVSSVPEVGSYYTGEELIGLDALDISSVSSGTRKYWFVLDSENAWWTPKEKLWVETHATLLEVLYLRVRENINLRIYVYDP